LDTTFFRFVTNHAFDKRTDGRTEFSSLDRVCISYSAVKIEKNLDCAHSIVAITDKNIRVYRRKLQECHRFACSRPAYFGCFRPLPGNAGLYKRFSAAYKTDLPSKFHRNQSIRFPSRSHRRKWRTNIYIETEKLANKWLSCSASR